MFARLWKHCPKHLPKPVPCRTTTAESKITVTSTLLYDFPAWEAQKFRFSTRIRIPPLSTAIATWTVTRGLKWKGPTISQSFTQLCCSFSFEINLANWMEKQKGSLIINSTLSQYELCSSTVYKITCLIHTLHHQQQTAFSQIISHINN